MTYKISIERDGQPVVHQVIVNEQKVIDIMANIIMDNTSLSGLGSSLVVDDKNIVKLVQGLKKKLAKKKNYTFVMPVPKKIGRPAKVKDEGAEMVKKGVKKRQSPLCPKCGERGHRVRTCPNGDRSLKQTEQEAYDGPQREPLDEDQWNDVRVTRGHGMSPVDIASQMNITVRAVNIALQSYSFEAYLKSI